MMMGGGAKDGDRGLQEDAGGRGDTASIHAYST